MARAASAIFFRSMTLGPRRTPVGFHGGKGGGGEGRGRGVEMKKWGGRQRARHAARPAALPATGREGGKADGQPGSQAGSLAVSGSSSSTPPPPPFPALPTHAPVQVMTTRALESSMRLASASAEKPPNTTEWMAPMRAQASIAMGSCGWVGSSRIPVGN